MRTGLDATTDTLYTGGDFDVYTRLKIENGDDTPISLEGRYFNLSVKLPDPREPIGSLSVDLIRELTLDGTDSSLAPLVENSTFNKLDDTVTYSPLIQLGRVVTLDVILVTTGDPRPGDGDSRWYEIFKGIVAKVSWPKHDKSSLRIHVNGLAAQLQIQKTEAEYTYAAGSSIETVVSDILTNNGITGVTTYFPAATGKVLSNAYAPGIQKSIWEQMQSLANSMGWVVYYRYRGTGGAELTFFEPARSKVTPDMTVTTDDFSSLSVDESEVRNVGYLVFVDANGAEQLIGPTTNAASISKYGGSLGLRRPFWIKLDGGSPIRDSTAANEMLTAAVSDVADPDVVASLSTFPLVFAESGIDLYTVPSQDRFFDTAQTWALFGCQLSFAHNKEPRSKASLRGVPTAGTKTWRDLATDLPSTESQIGIDNAYLRAVPHVDAGPATFAGDTRPDSDVDNTDGWTENGAGSALYQVLDESTFNDSDYCTSVVSASECGAGTDDLAFTIGLSNPGTAPATSAEQTMVLRTRLRRGTANAGTADFLVELLETSTVIASFTHNNVGTSFTQFNDTLSNSEVDAIGNHNNLRVRITATICADDELNPITAEVSWCELAYTVKSAPAVTGVLIDLVYDPKDEVDDLNIIVNWDPDDGSGTSSYVYTKSGINGTPGTERLQGPGATDFFMREDWISFNVQVTPVAQPNSRLGLQRTYYLEDATESGAGSKYALSAGGTVFADYAVSGTNVTIDTDLNGRPRINSTAAGGASALNDLTDVVITGPLVTGDFLRYDGATYVDTPLVAGDIPDLDAAKITTGTFGVGRGGTGAATYASGEVLYGGGGTNPIASSTSVTITGGSTLNATEFVGGGAGLTDVATGALTLQTPDPTTGTYYPLLTPDSGGDAAVYVDSSDLRWNATDSQLLTADGANGSPSYSFISDPDTGMFLDAVGTLALATAGAVRLDVSSTAIEANIIPFRATASTSGHFGHSGFSACTHITTNLSYDGSGSPFTAANWRYISAAGASSTAGWVLLMAGNGGETGQSVELYSVPTSTGANATPASFTQRLKITNGQIQFGDGTQADPAYSFLSDDNTGFYRNATGSVRYSADNVSVLEMDGTGLNVLTGNLEMAGGVSIENGGNIWVGTQDGNVEPQIYFDESDAPADESRWRIVASAGDLFFQGREDPGDGFQNPTWMRFNRSGYTATSVTMGADLLPSTNNSWDLGSDALRWKNAYVEALDIKTTLDSPILDGIRADATIASGNTLLQVTGKGDLGSGPAFGADILIQADQTWVQGTDSGARLAFRTTAQGTWNTPVERMRIDHDGQVGIGEINPLTLLHLSSASGGNMVRIQDTVGTGTTANPYIDFYDSAARIGYIGYGSAGNGDLTIQNEVANHDLVLRATGTGNFKFVTIDATNDCLLELENSSGRKGYIQARDAGLTIGNDVANTPISFRDNGIGFNMLVLDYNANYQALINAESDPVFALNTTSATGNPYMAWLQNNTRRAYIQFIDSSNKLYINVDSSTTHDFGIAVGGNTKLNLNSLGSTSGEWLFQNAQVAVEEQAEITAIGNQTINWDLGNSVGITNVGARTITVNDTLMQEGGHYNLIVRNSTGVVSDWTWTTSGVLHWQNGQEPIFGTNAGDYIVVTFIRSGSVVLGFWALAT